MMLAVVLQRQRGEAKRQELYTGSLTGLVCHSRSDAAAIHNDSWEDRASHTGIQAWMQGAKWRKESCRGGKGKEKKKDPDIFCSHAHKKSKSIISCSAGLNHPHFLSHYFSLFAQTPN
ncbi:hypothetical protein ILYODFUR_032937 [Ilyodon furcidens]|uniref:Uncharacterized protein n=1 Tax=Ilyodon furcidens TaxID=33524 RepID=A0ABV0U101_9TELE